jgi:hypothetical protein
VIAIVIEAALMQNLERSELRVGEDEGRGIARDGAPKLLCRLLRNALARDGGRERERRIEDAAIGNRGQGSGVRTD